jgi:glycolate oxidase FAD binding subunit
MNAVVEHASGDLIAVVRAGTPLAALNARVGEAGQMLAIDSYDRRATIGGVVAANASGPRRLRYGTMRDLLIGITVVRADGTIARAGGKVVKNVAGYDLGKLFVGSFGTLGLIVEIVVRLHALPADRRLVVVDIERTEAVRRVVQALKESAVVPSAVELVWEDGHGRVVVLFEGVSPSVVDQAERTQRALVSVGDVSVAEDLGTAWDSLVQWPWQADDIGLKITARPSDVPLVLDELDRISSLGVRSRVQGQAASAVLYVALRPEATAHPDSADGASSHGAVIEAIERLRDGVLPTGGSVTVLQASPNLKRSIDVWGPVGDALPLMQRVKQQFDPERIMSPGRFVGAI